MKLISKPNVVILQPDSADQILEAAGTLQDVQKWYSREFKPKWSKDAHEVFGEPGTGKNSDTEQAEFLERVKSYMNKYASMFSFVGMGSERVSFVTADRKYCIKLCAPNDAYYRNQIESETQAYARFGKPDCIYTIIDFDAELYTSQLCECCEVADEDSWLGVFGVQYPMTMDICNVIAQHGGRFDFPERLKDMIRARTPGNPDFIDLLTSSGDPAYASLRSWIEIRAKTKMQSLRDSVRHIENWGLTTKDGKPVMKLIDAGL